MPPYRPTGMKPTGTPRRPMHRTACIALLLWLILAPAPAAADPGGGERLAYVASYRGLLSVGLGLDIAAVTLTLPPLAGIGPEAAEALLSFTTQGFRKVEMILPMQFCYRSRLVLPTPATQEADWWSRIGSKVSRGRLDFDVQHRRVLRRHVERKLTARGTSSYALEQRLSSASWASAPDPDRSEAALPPQAPPMDRLALLQWLRRQPLVPGMVLDPAVSDGHRLLGFHIEVEGEDSTLWGGRSVPSLRIRLQPRFSDDTDNRPTWLWLGRDARRLPLLFRSSRVFGHFEVRLEAAAAQAQPQPCAIPEAAELALPAL